MSAHVDASAGTPPARPLLILDVDGVLNTASMAGGTTLHPKLLKRLAGLIVDTECDVVLSTTWRLREKPTEILLLSLEKVGVPRARVVGRTPRLELRDLPAGADTGCSDLGEAHRAHEIVAFVDGLARADDAPAADGGDDGGAPPRTWAAVDDLDLLRCAPTRGMLEGHFVRTSDESGLTERACDALRAILRPPPPDAPGALFEPQPAAASEEAAVATDGR